MSGLAFFAVARLDAAEAAKSHASGAADGLMEAAPVAASTAAPVAAPMAFPASATSASSKAAGLGKDTRTATPPAVRILTLDACLSEAMANNRRRPASRFAVAMAEAQHRQALAGYWPQLGLRASAQRRDESPNFVFPGMQMQVPAQTVQVPAGTAILTLPAQLVNPAAPAGATIEVPVATPAQVLGTPAQVFTIPSQDVKLMDEDSLLASLQALWLLYDGGMRKGYREQAQGMVDMMRQEERRTDLEIADSVKRMYYGAILAELLHRIGADTLARMEATLTLTEMLYKEGSGRVKKTDWLDNKMMAASLRSMVALLEKNALAAQAALAHTMGLAWDASVRPAVQELPHLPFAGGLEQTVGTAYRFSPDWAQLEAGLRAAEGAVRTAKSGHFPKVALTGELNTWSNDYRAGLATARNKDSWVAGVAVEVPLFDGFLTRAKVSEARARAAKLREEQVLLKEGIGLQVRDAFLSLAAAEKACAATEEAMKAAEENRDLNTRAYQNELVDTEKVIRAQLMEALMVAQHHKARYDHLALQSRLCTIVGTEVMKKFE